MAEHHPPLNYENSLTATNRQTSTTLPPEVSQCLKNARFLHLATISSSQTDPNEPPTPHVSLMNYTFLPNYSSLGPVIVMTTNAQSLKTQNLISNPRVSLLVHDWVSHRPPTVASSTTGGETGRSGSPPGGPSVGRSSLASLLLNLNTAALSSISTTISGEAKILEAGSEEEKWCKEAHLQNNTFEGQLSTEAGYFGGGGATQRARDAGSASGYIDGDDVRVVMVPVRTGRISDFKGGVRDWQVVDDEDENQTPAVSTEQAEPRGRNSALPNGVAE